MNKKVFFGIVILTMGAVIFSIGCNSSSHTGAEGSHKIKVVTTLFPLYDFAKNVGKDKVEVSLLLPPGVEAHSFEPKPSDIIKINEADLFVYTGKFMEPWAAGVIKGVSNKNLIVIDASQGTKMIPGVFHDEDEPAGSLDPHIWLDFDNAKIMINNIMQGLQTKDTLNKDFYKEKADEYNKKLTEMDITYSTTLSPYKGKTIIYGGHYAFGYLARRYGLIYLAAQGVSPDAEPTANDLAKLVEQIKKDNIKYVYYEELTSPKIAETIANETNAKMLLLNAAHNLTKDQFEHGLSFLDILKEDLANLKVGLQAQQ
ncbi:MAG: zinc ABC transporter substrate-binding protein [Desulfomonilia bacterium]|jgi:zinc transport system substrate-binding protein